MGLKGGCLVIKWGCKVGFLVLKLWLKKVAEMGAERSMFRCLNGVQRRVFLC